MLKKLVPLQVVGRIFTRFIIKIIVLNSVLEKRIMYVIIYLSMYVFTTSGGGITGDNQNKPFLGLFLFFKSHKEYLN